MIDFSNNKLEILDYMNRLNIKILDLYIKYDDPKLFIGFKTTTNTYEMSVDMADINKIIHSNTKWSSTLYMTRFIMNELSFHVLFNMLNQMANANDTSAIGFLFEAICTYWDIMFAYPTSNLPSRAICASNKLNQFINGVNEYSKVWLTDPVFFMNFVTGTIGNKLYFDRNIYKRKEMQDRVEGIII